MDWQAAETLLQTAVGDPKEWFVHLRFPGHEHVKIKACPGHRSGNGVPEGWDQRESGEIATVKKEKNITRETVIEGNVPVVAGGLKPAYYHSEANSAGPVITVSASGANAGHVSLITRVSGHLTVPA